MGKMNFWIGLICGLFIGANMGLLVYALCISAGKRPEYKVKYGENSRKIDEN